MDYQIAYGQSELTDRLNFSPINIVEDDDGIQIEWRMPESALDDPSGFQFPDWFWDNYSGYSIPITTITIILPESKSAEDLIIDVSLQDDVAWQNDIPLADVEIMLSDDGEELPNMRPVALELPTEPIFVLRQGRLRGIELIIIGVSPIFDADGDPRVVTKIDATISGVALFEDDKNTQPISPLATIENNSPLAPPSATTEAGMVSPLSSPPSSLSPSVRTLTVRQTATAEAMIELTQVETVTPKPTATKRVTQTPTKEATATSRATATHTATATSVATTLNLDEEMIPSMANLEDDTKDLAVVAVETIQPTTVPAIISILNTPEVEGPVATVDLVIVDENWTLSTTVPLDGSTELANNAITTADNMEVAPNKPIEQIWSPLRYISRTWLVLPIFLVFMGSILFVFTRKPTNL